MNKKSEWRDYVPQVALDNAQYIGAGIGALSLGAAASILGEKKKWLRNFLLGALAGGSFGYASGNLVHQNDILHREKNNFKNKAIAAENLSRYLENKLSHYRSLPRVTPISEIKEDGMSAFDKAKSSIRIPIDQAKFVDYHELVKQLENLRLKDERNWL